MNESQSPLSQEHARLADTRQDAPWKKWGPYLSERQWGTVREDYSENGDAWNYFTHDQARSRAYKWGEDGLAGFSDEKARLCWALALWNENDPILKERLFGLSNSEANHGEDVKEYYYYLDSTPTHSYMKYLYKYPQATFPYNDLVSTNRQRSRQEMEYELIDTGIFDEDRYFDVFVEYAKAAPQDILFKIRVINRGPQAAPLHILPHLWFRNTWWMKADTPRPNLSRLSPMVIQAESPELGVYYLYCEDPDELLFTENESNLQRLFGQANPTPYVKDGIHNAVIHHQAGAVNPQGQGTKAAAHFILTLEPGEERILRLRLAQQAPGDDFQPFGQDFQVIFDQRKQEADEFYATLTPPSMSADEASVMRQALAGMLWTKQYYFFDLDLWLSEHSANPSRGQRKVHRNREWYHMISDNIISMPDKWEYPWFAAWDLAFHTIALKMVDEDFAREQLYLVLRELHLHPSGQVPAYEWNFSDTNPPVQAWATLFNFTSMSGSRVLSEPEVSYLERIFKKLLLNFTWWVNRKDTSGNNLFSGGFLGMDNIGLFDRSQALPTGGHLEQADGTAWMAFFSQNMVELSAILSLYNPSYMEFVYKFVEHFLWIAGSMDRVGDRQEELWDEEDGFFYDVLVLPNGQAQRIPVRSMVGLLPLCAVTVLPPPLSEGGRAVVEHIKAFINKHPDLVANLHPISQQGKNGRFMLSILNEEKLRRILARMLDEERFFSPYGIRSLSRWHLDHPFEVDLGGEKFRVQYQPAESDSGMFGGNSNWRGPIWMPMNLLILRALLQYYQYYGDDFKVECPTGSGQMMNLYEVAIELTRRLSAIFLKDERGKRPIFGEAPKFRDDPHWRDYVLFYEYFHGDNGAGLGASHQTGWSGNVARLLQLLHTLTPEELLRQERKILAPLEE